MPLFPTSFSIDVHVPEALASATGKGIPMRHRQTLAVLRLRLQITGRKVEPSAMSY